MDVDKDSLPEPIRAYDLRVNDELAKPGELREELTEREGWWVRRNVDERKASNASTDDLRQLPEKLIRCDGEGEVVDFRIVHQTPKVAERLC